MVWIKDILWFSSNNGVLWGEGALNASPEELHNAVKTAFGHLTNRHLIEACHGNRGPLANLGDITYEEFIARLNNIEIQ